MATLRDLLDHPKTTPKIREKLLSLTDDFDKIRMLSKDKKYQGYSFIQKTYTNCTTHPRFAAEERYGFKGYYL